MKFFIPIIYGSKLSKNYFLILSVALLCSSNLNAQQYPPSTNMSLASYNPPTPLPDYLEPFNEENFGNKVTRISDQLAFSVGDQLQLRHTYSKRQAWNSDGSYLVLAGYPPKILDGNDYTLLGDATDFGNFGWSNTNRLLSYYTSGSSNVFQIRQLNETTYASTTIFTKTFSDYNILSHFTSESNISMDDKYTALYGTKSSTGTSCWVVVYDIELDIIVSETNLNTPLSNVDWVAMSHSGNYVVIAYMTVGLGVTQGVWAYDRLMNNDLQLVDSPHHADLGVDLDGNEVLVYNGSNDIVSIRLDGVGSPIVYLNTAISGGHVSCRNNNRPGWAYVNDHGAISQPGDYDSFKEVFAVKLDNKPNGITTVQRFTKHYTYTDSQYYTHEPQASPSRDGTRIVFASTMEDSQTEQQQYPFSWIVETQNSNLGVEDDVLNNTKFSMYPNPSKGEVNLEFTGIYDVSNIYLTDLMGKIIYSENINTNNGLTFSKTLQLNTLSKGIYFITIRGSRESVTKKLILK